MPEEVSGVEGDGSVVNKADGATCVSVTCYFSLVEGIDSSFFLTRHDIHRC